MNNTVCQRCNNEYDPVHPSADACANCGYAKDLEYYDYQDLWEEEEDTLVDCGQLSDGSCGAAGSEYCEFECPYR